MEPSDKARSVVDCSMGLCAGAQAPIPADQFVGRTVVLQRRLHTFSQLGDNAHRKNLAQFDACLCCRKCGNFTLARCRKVAENDPAWDGGLPSRGGGPRPAPALPGSLESKRGGRRAPWRRACAHRAAGDRPAWARTVRAAKHKRRRPRRDCGRSIRRRVGRCSLTRIAEADRRWTRQAGARSMR